MAEGEGNNTREEGERNNRVEGETTREKAAKKERMRWGCTTTMDIKEIIIAKTIGSNKSCLQQFLANHNIPVPISNPNTTPQL
jgi:hypothetical protein